MTKIWAMRGYSGSGKSVRAREIADKHDSVVVNRDLLRLQLLGEYWTGRPVDEERVTIAEDAQVKAFLNAGVSVVIDATHLAPKFLRKWAKLATQQGHEFEVVDVLTGKAECRENDIMRGILGEREVGKDVIDRQVKNFPQNKWPKIVAQPFPIEPVEFIPGLPDAVIFDIDGTLAKNISRSPFDYSKVLEDEVHPDVAWMANAFHAIFDLELAATGTVEVIVMSGRDDTCRVDTERWLDMYDIHYDQLIMRPAEAKDNHGNKLPDYQVKYDLFNTHVRGKYNVRTVFDDRRQVVEVWRRMGLKCAQVEDGDF